MMLIKFMWEFLICAGEALLSRPGDDRAPDEGPHNDYLIAAARVKGGE